MSGQIATLRDKRVAGRAEDHRHVEPLVAADLDRYPSAGLEMVHGLQGEQAIGVQPVLAAVERSYRIEVAHFGSRLAINPVGM